MEKQTKNIAVLILNWNGVKLLQKYLTSIVKHNSSEAEIICGGNFDKSTGYFIEPTAILTTNPHFKSMEEEIFGQYLLY